jgi:hypothetical protein
VRDGGSGGVGCGAETVVNGGSELLIFVPGATHGQYPDRKWAILAGGNIE